MMIQIDWYTRCVLTVIAVCLVWMCFGSSKVVTPLEAQANQQRVLVAGWVDVEGYVHQFARQGASVNKAEAAPLPVHDAR